MGSIALPPFPLPHTARGQFSIGRAPCLGIVPPGTPGGWSSPGVLFLGPLNPPLCPGFILAPFCARRRSRPLRPCSQRSRGSLAHDGLGRPFELRRGLSSRLAAGHTAPHPHTLACGCLRHVCRTSVSPVCSHSRWWFSMSIKNSNEITQNKTKNISSSSQASLDWQPCGFPDTVGVLVIDLSRVVFNFILLDLYSESGSARLIPWAFPLTFLGSLWAQYPCPGISMAPLAHPRVPPFDLLDVQVHHWGRLLGLSG